MPILFSNYARNGTFRGMPVIEETGLATDDSGALADLLRYEPGRVEIEAIPRARGLIVKALDGQPVRTNLLVTDQFGRFPNCFQMGPTQIQPFAPKQPIGPQAGRRINAFRRTWVQLQD